MEAEVHAADYWTEPRRELRAFLERNAPSLGELYEGALRMLYADDFPGRTRFIAHAVREIRNRLPEVLSGVKFKPGVQYENQLDRIAHEWERSELSLDGDFPRDFTQGSAALPIKVAISRRLFLRIAGLIKEHLASRITAKEKAIRLFESIAPENQQSRDSLRPIFLQWYEQTEWFMKKAHDSEIRDKDVDGREFRTRFEIVETYLISIVRDFYKTLGALDEILEDTNS